MKPIIIKIISGCLIGACSVLNSFSQSMVLPNDQGGNTPENLDRNNVPGMVTNSYTIEYPKTTYETWYYYPSNSYNEGSEWYVYSPSVIVETEPQYYVVEFTKDGVPHRVVYSKEGKKIGTYKTLKEALPKAITYAVSKSAYKNWAITKEKEEMWQESDKKKVYKLTVENGKQKHDLYYREDGKLLKDKDRS